MELRRSTSGSRAPRVVSFEGRRRREAAGLIRRSGGSPRVVAAIRGVPAPAGNGASALLERGADVLVLMTGVGARLLLGKPGVRRALRGAALVARGPKPAEELRRAGLKASLTVPAPATTAAVLKSLRKLALKGKRVAVQEGGTPDPEFLAALERRGAEVLRLALYRWTLPQDAAPLRGAVRDVAAGRADVVLFSNSNQAASVFQVARDLGLAEGFRAGLARAVVGSVGPFCTERLARFGVKPDVEPSEPKLEALVRESLAFRKPRVRVAAVPPKNGPSGAEPLFLRACRRERTERAPVWLMRQAGRYMESYRRLRSKVSMLELCKHPDLVAEVTVDAVEKLGVDAAILFSDLLLVAEPLGLKLEYSKGEGPVLTPPLRGPRDVARLRKVDAASDLGYVAEAVRRTRAALPADVPLIGFSGAPFTLASYLIEGGGSRQFLRTKTFLYREPAAWHSLMRKLVDCLGDYLEMQVDAGAQAVQVFDSWVGCLSPGDYKVFVQPHSRALLSRLRGRAVRQTGTAPGGGRVPVIHFGTQTAGLLELMRDAGGDVVGVDWRIRLDEAWDRLGRNVAVMGNLDPLALMAPPRELRARAADILKRAGGRRGHIFNLGHGILPETPLENVKTLVKAVKELSAR
jgi:uroporphyrinogen decarboxylase